VNNSKIEWTDATWNPIVGCSKVSEGCRNCYAMTMAARIANAAQAALRQGKGLTDVQAAYRNVVKWENGKDRAAGENDKALPQWNNLIAVIDSVLTLPLRWKSPRRIFVNSMADLFHESVPFEVIDQVFAVMALCPEHSFQILTKRPERMAEYLNQVNVDQFRSMVFVNTLREFKEPKSPEPFRRASEAVKWPLPNVWLGTSVENQEQFLKRVRALIHCPATVRFLSCEPLVGELVVTDLFPDDPNLGFDPLTGRMWGGIPGGEDFFESLRIHWVICGGESGHGARPMQLEWARSLRDQCQAAGVPFFFKQWGEHSPYYEKADTETGRIVLAELPHGESRRVGKKAAGRLLDGREWNEFPGVAKDA